jgi:hypothetical protein
MTSPIGKNAMVVALKSAAEGAAEAATEVAQGMGKFYGQTAQKLEQAVANTVKGDAEAAASYQGVGQSGTATAAKTTLATSISQLGARGEAAYNTIKDAINRAAGRTAQEVRQSLSDDQIKAGRAEGPYLQRMFYGTSVENAVANDPAVLADDSISHLGTSMPGQKVPDFTITADGQTFNMDVTGPSESSIDSHLARPYISDPSQVLTYPAPSNQFLSDVFK